MNPVPTQLVEELSHEDVQIAHEWWNSLAEEQQAKLATLYDSRRDSCRVRSKQITILVDSELLRDDEADTDDWADFYEYMLDHPEVFPPHVPFHRTFVIGCFSSKHGGHLVVEAASSGFLCMFNSPVCPFRR
jgi:hypothetical protein